MTSDAGDPAAVSESAPEPEVLWRPNLEVERGHLGSFLRRVRAEHGLDLTSHAQPRHAQPTDDQSSYEQLWRWSVEHLDDFWSTCAEHLGVRWHAQPRAVRDGDRMPDVRWFPGGTLNYAEHALAGGVAGATKADDEIAVLFDREDGLREELTYGQLRARVAAMAAALRELGVGHGDRVVALVANSPHALIAFLATASLGAVWSSCSPDFGPRAIADRFTQIAPKVLLTVDGYYYNGRAHDVTATAEQLTEAINPAAVISIDYIGTGRPAGAHDWASLLARHEGAELHFRPVEAEHPLWVLYSSGTTGLPKGIVQGHGGITVEHLKTLALHLDLGPGQRFFWFTTTGWMMWNFLISGLLVGATVVLYDGSPAHPDLGVLWRLAARHRVTYFGTSAPYVQSCMKQGVDPTGSDGLPGLRAIGTTGAPLSSEGFRWLVDELGTDELGRPVQVCSVSGGTDVCTAFLGAAPNVPVWLGELSCRVLGAAVAAYDDAGREVIDEVGELVITQPMPSMPVSFWNDPDGSRLRAAYFEDFPGVWRHGDWVKITLRGSAVIYGRSDSTLNRGGVRMGTAEFYRVVESDKEVTDSLVIDTSRAGAEDGKLLCFVVLAEQARFAEVRDRLRSEVRSALSPRHVPDEFVPVPDVPRTLNGKKCEVPVKKILTGTDPAEAVSADALANPAALEAFIARAG